MPLRATEQQVHASQGDGAAGAPAVRRQQWCWELPQLALSAEGARVS